MPTNKNRNGQWDPYNGNRFAWIHQFISNQCHWTAIVWLCHPVLRVVVNRFLVNPSISECLAIIIIKQFQFRYQMIDWRRWTRLGVSSAPSMSCWPSSSVASHLPSKAIYKVQFCPSTVLMALLVVTGRESSSLKAIDWYNHGVDPWSWLGSPIKTHYYIGCCAPSTMYGLYSVGTTTFGGAPTNGLYVCS